MLRNAKKFVAGTLSSSLLFSNIQAPVIVSAEPLNTSLQVASDAEIENANKQVTSDVNSLDDENKSDDNSSLGDEQNVGNVENDETTNTDLDHGIQEESQNTQQNEDEQLGEEQTEEEPNIDTDISVDSKPDLNKGNDESLNVEVTSVVEPNLTKLDANQTYEKVLDIYEEYFQYGVRFDETGKNAKITGEEWFNDIETVGINRERAKTQFIPYQNADVAFNAEKTVMDDIGAETSDYYKKLSGTKWDFALVTTPEEAKKKDEEWLAKDYSGNDFKKEYVPSAWQTYRNADGTFKYDEPMYTNHGLPWEKNFQVETYLKPEAPTKYNPVGYYRTKFTLDESWKNREVFISLQSVESAYYLYVNGKPVGYSTDSFTAHDFNITPYLNPDGENTIALKVFRWSIGSWLENQDFIRQSGINRDVYLYSKGEAEIRDYFIKTEFNSESDLVNSDVTLNLETTLRGLRNDTNKNYKVSARLLDKNGSQIAKASEQQTEIKKSSDKTPEQKLKDEGTLLKSTMVVENPDKWFPDTPNLYYLEILLKDDSDNVIESIVETVGFRDIRIVNTPEKNENGKFLEQIQINGKQMVLRGVNRHDADVEKGHAVGYEEYFTDLTTMKQHNLNAIRTSHYPNDAVMYDLADELGIYICMDANVESHRAASTGVKVPTGVNGESKKWVAPVLDRNATMIERYKNNPSVVIWSSNNEAQYIKVNYNSHSCFWVASMYALKRDPSRLRKSERASAYQEQIQQGDPWSTESRVKNIVDIHSTQYASPNGVDIYSNVQPYVHSEYNHAMGQSYGNATEHWDVIRKRDNVNGGFIWDYIDQSILTVNKDDTSDKFWGYGGDWIDTKMNDDAFCGNGLVYADHTPSPKIREAKKVHQQVNFYMENKPISPTDTISINIVNEYENTSLDNFDISWSIYKNSDFKNPLASEKVTTSLKPISGQSINDNSEAITINLKEVLSDFKPISGEDYFLDFSVKLKKPTNWNADVGFEIAHEQFELDFKDKQEQPYMDTSNIRDFESIKEQGNNVILTGETDQKQKFEIVLNKQNGTIDSYKINGNVVMKAGPELSIHRAQTYNDTTAYWDEKTKNAGNFENLSNIEVEINTTSEKNKVVMSMSGDMQVDAFNKMSYEIYGNGEILVSNQFSPKSDFASKGGLSKVGSRMIVTNEYDNLKYYGRGPWDTYVDRENAARIGLYENKVEDSFDKKMLKPQENGNHTDVRWTSLTNDKGDGFLVSSNNQLEISALPYTAEELNNNNYNNAQYRHPNKVPMRDDSVVWNIDYKQRGVSDTAFMGHVPLEGYTVPTNQEYLYSYRITPITSDSDIEVIASERYEMDTVGNPVSGIFVNGQPVENFLPMKTEYEVILENDVTQLNITAEGINTKVVDNRDGTFTITGGNDGNINRYTLKILRIADELPKENHSIVKVYNSYSGNPDKNLIDWNNRTFWDIDWTVSGEYSEDKRYIAVELSESDTVSSLKYLPRQDGSKNLNGSVSDYLVYVSSKPISELFTDDNVPKDINSSDWTKVSEGTWEKNKDWKIAQFDDIKNIKTVILVGKGTYGDTENTLISGAEVHLTKGYDASSAVVTLPDVAPIIKGKSEPIPTVVLNGKALIDGVDFTVSYKNNTKTGETATATINFKGIYGGNSIDKNFVVGEEQVVFHTITFNTDGGTQIEPIEVEYGKLLNEKDIPKTTKKGYRFDGWWNYNFTQAFDFNQPILQDVTLYAKWTKDSENDSSSGGSGSGGSSSSGSSGSRPATPVTEPTQNNKFEIPQISENGSVEVVTQKGEKIKISSNKTNDGIEIQFEKDGKNIDKVDGGVVVALPTSEDAPGFVAVAVNQNGTNQILRNSYIKDGKMIANLYESCLVKIENRALMFNDVKETHWYKDSVDFVTARDLFKGATENEFAPDSQMERGMLAAVLYRLAGEPSVVSNKSFSDVSQELYYAPSVAWAAQNGFVAGTSATTFSPNTSITREQLASILYRFVASPKSDASIDKFSDSNMISSWAKDAMVWAVENNIMVGNTDGTLNPLGNVTRAEASTMLTNYIKNCSDSFLVK